MWDERFRCRAQGTDAGAAAGWEKGDAWCRVRDEEWRCRTWSAGLRVQMKDLGCRRQPQDADPGNGCGMQEQDAVGGCSSRREGTECRIQGAGCRCWIQDGDVRYK